MASFRPRGPMTPFPDFEARAAKSIEMASALSHRLAADPLARSAVAGIAQLVLEALSAGNKLILFGNGGSAADCQHIAADFVGRFAFDRDALPAMALTVNTSSLTAIANDYGFEHVFSRQIQGLGRPGDVAMGLSTSGNSPNVLRGLAAARELGLRTVALTGASGGKLKDSLDLDFCVCVPSDETPRIQECHTLIGHVISELVEQDFFHAQGRLPGS